MSNLLPNYLRTYRKRAGLTQDEIAFLLGTKSGAKVSRYERFQRQPSVQTVLAYQVIFRTSADELFAGIFQQVERKLVKRAQTLLHKLNRAQPDFRNARKLEYLKAIIPGSYINLDKES